MKKLLIVILSSFAVMSLSAQNVQTSDTVVTKKAPSWRIALHGGYAFQTGMVFTSLNVFDIINPYLLILS